MAQTGSAAGTGVHFMRLGVDLGGTKIEILALNSSGQELFRRRAATPQNDYEAILQTIAELVSLAEGETGQRGTVGICTPGSLSPVTGKMRNSNSVCMNGKPFRHDIEVLLGREVRTTNDANCFALSEATDGAATGAHAVFGVIIGTGCGGGLVIDGKVQNGVNGIAGEWGHNPLPWPDDGELANSPCWCGQVGCLETFISGTGFARDYDRLSGRKLSGKQILERFEQGDSDAEEVLCRYELRLAKSLAVVINIVDPDVIVLGGGMSNIARLYEVVPTLWEPFVFSDVINTQLLSPKFGDSSGVRGAAWLW